MRRLLLLALSTVTFLRAKRPTITVVCVVDQLAHHLLDRHKPFLRGGIKKMLDNGLVYTNAYYPHGQPATATGHAALSTGATASAHGLIANEWYCGPDKKVKACDDGHPETCGVFSPTGTYPRGKSADSIHAPTLSESCIRDINPYISLSLSLKSRAAIPTAGPYGTPIWFNSKVGQFTSSKAFGPRLPAWARAMNKHLKETLHQQETTQWPAQFPDDHPAYQLVHTKKYQYTGYQFPLVNNPRPLRSGSKPYFLFQQTPQANKILLQLAELALRRKRTTSPEHPIILWLSLSSLDYVGHYYGPQSKEVVDLLHHIDQQLGTFINHIERDYGKENCAWMLTADHGVMPIPEHLAAQGRTAAQRLDATALINDLNRIIYKHFNVKNLIHGLLASNMYLDHGKWDPLAAEVKRALIPFIKSYLNGLVGIANAWHHTDFSSPVFKKTFGIKNRARWFANQYFNKRSGDFIIQVQPYTYLSSYNKGTSHDSCYDYDVRVPLVFYAPGRIKPNSIDEEVCMLHIPTTLAHLLNVHRPALAPTKILPGFA